MRRNTFIGSGLVLASLFGFYLSFNNGLQMSPGGLIPSSMYANLVASGTLFVVGLVFLFIKN